MTIDTIKYPSPVTVNGFRCSDCNEVDQAARHIDPAHPRSGVDDIDAQQDPTRSQADKQRIARLHAASAPAYRLDGSHAESFGVRGAVIDRTA